MTVPEEIKAVKRPVNTIVEDSGKDSVVRESGETVCVPGSNPKPGN